MASIDQRYWIVFNGEIYNFIELREELKGKGHTFRSRSDTEVLLAAWLEWGADAVKRLRGMFAFAVWDTRQSHLTLARDRTGEKPLYYLFQPGQRFFFASELKALLRLADVRPLLDPVALDRYFHLQYIPEPQTALLGVSKVAPAQLVHLDVNTWRVTQRTYWSLADIGPRQGEPVAAVRSALEQAVEMTLRADVPVAVSLSGGLDSSAVAALAARKSAQGVTAFSVGYEGRPPSDERAAAALLANALGFAFQEVELSDAAFVRGFPKVVAALDDPVADIAAFANYAVAKAAHDAGFKVILGGLGGDELFWGYRWVTRAAQNAWIKRKIVDSLARLPFASRLADRPAAVLGHTLTNTHTGPGPVRLPTRVLNRLRELGLAHSNRAPYPSLLGDFVEARRARNAWYGAAMAGQLHSEGVEDLFVLPHGDRWHVDAGILSLLFQTWLASNCLVLSDRMSMATSVESRVPFLDHKLIETVFGLRHFVDDRQDEPKSLLRKAMRGILPEDVLRRPKRGFEPPVARWTKGVIDAYATTVEDGHLVQAGYLRQDTVRGAVKTAIEGQGDAFLVYKALVLEWWYRGVVLGQGAD